MDRLHCQVIYGVMFSPYAIPSYRKDMSQYIIKEATLRKSFFYGVMYGLLIFSGWHEMKGDAQHALSYSSGGGWLCWVASFPEDSSPPFLPFD